MSNRVAKAADQNPQQTGIPAAIATVARADRDGSPAVLEVDGLLYERPFDQDKLRKHLAQSERLDQIVAAGVPRSLLNQVEIDVASDILDDWRANMRGIGHILVQHGQHDLWRLVYLEYNRENLYAVGDEVLFLSGEPTAGEDGYKGPPTYRWNTAVKQAAQARGEG